MTKLKEITKFVQALFKLFMQFSLTTGIGPWDRCTLKMEDKKGSLTFTVDTDDMSSVEVNIEKYA